MNNRLMAWLVSFALTLTAPAARAEDFILDISGSPALLVKVKCTVVGPGDGSNVIKFESFVPRKYLLQYDAVACSVQKWDARGRLRVMLLDASTAIAFAETAAAYNYVTVRSDGPWGTAAGFRGTIAFPLGRQPSTETLQLNRGLVPPLNPPLVPPLNVQTPPPAPAP